MFLIEVDESRANMQYNDWQEKNMSDEKAYQIYESLSPKDKL